MHDWYTELAIHNGTLSYLILFLECDVNNELQSFKIAVDLNSIRVEYVSCWWSFFRSRSRDASNIKGKNAK